MSSPSSSPLFSTSPTLLPMAHASPLGLSHDELVERMNVVPDPRIPFLPNEHYNNSYFGFLTWFRRAVHAAVPGASKYQQTITKEAARRWRRCDQYTKSQWSLLADASRVFAKKLGRKNASNTTRSPKAHRVSGSSREQARRWSPYSRTYNSGPASSMSYLVNGTSLASTIGLQSSVQELPLPFQAASSPAFSVLPPWDSSFVAWGQASYNYAEDESFSCDAPVTFYALDACPDDGLFASVSGAYNPNDVLFDFDNGSLLAGLGQVTHSRPSSEPSEVSPALTFSGSFSPPSSVDLPVSDYPFNVELPTLSSYGDEVLNALCLEFSGLQANSSPPILSV